MLMLVHLTIWNFLNLTSKFHLLLPASSGNKNLCRLLLSSIINDYPVPVLVNWDATETEDVFDQHIAKVQTTLDYLRQFPPERENELVLVVDAFDVWFQLPPEVLLRRYFDMVKMGNERNEVTYGKETAREHGLKQTVFFGNDKACWPTEEDEHPGRLACLAVPQSTLPKYALGPVDDEEQPNAEKDNYHARARWLNSGTVIGPVKDVRAFFEAVGKRVREHNTVKSDQFYFARIWGWQEYARMELMPNNTLPDKDKITPPNVTDVIQDLGKVEFNVGLDYESSLFQSVGYYDPYLSWLKYDGSIQNGRPKDASIPYIEDFNLDDDIIASRPPLAVIKLPKKGKTAEYTKALFNYAQNIRVKQWHELPLLTNLVTKRTPTLVHFMMEKGYRVKWWDRMWFAPFARELFRASVLSTGLPISKKPINGTIWFNAEEPVVSHNFDNMERRRDGAWSDKGVWNGWNQLCQPYEDYVFTADQHDQYSNIGG
ncbi:uncharacterized protein KY384_002972 [Bacidia gigantensis]|uniref:uncharacterized protein n=1 Tax=Bacidia gigantensis TaxID=2732470 RepID=UPI001D044790|nr:uncharacterized protein KY384_002972 [Bacidia gigantensis]KAG8531343.1 hypothetical protein KY384_002972 [Bacidia gigantensis]